VKYNIALVKPSERTRAVPPHNTEGVRRRRVLEKLVQRSVRTSQGPRRAFPSCQALARELNRTHLELSDITKYTVRRDLKKLGLRALKCQRGPKRMAHDPAARMKACRTYLRLPLRDMKRLGFTDTKYFDTNSRGTQYEWCREGQTAGRILRETWCPRVHVWGVLHRDFRFIVRLSPGKLNAESFKRQCLMPFVQFLKNRKHPEGYVLFQMDGETAMNADSCQRYLESKGFVVLKDWPARSPELSPIENAWAIIQRRVDLRGPSDDNELWRFVKEEWEAISDDEARALVDSFRARLTRCVAAGGQTIHTKFKKSERQSL
jgi:DDE superfamily endonuclease